jgi:D-alanyl-D-alanine carboxypeptidase
MKRAAAALAVLLVLCTGGPALAMTPNVKPTADAQIHWVSKQEWALIRSTGTWRPGCPGGRMTFRRVDVNFHGFDGLVHRGTLIVNRDVASSVAKTMTKLFDEGFPIHRMHPIEYYGGDDNRSMRADNTSAMNCRTDAQANAPAKDSPHANGRAIDINPWENPWVDPRCGCFRPDQKFGSLRHGQGVITANGPVVRVFKAAGWIWRGTGKTPDLQHFDTGYPSRRP